MSRIVFKDGTVEEIIWAHGDKDLPKGYPQTIYSRAYFLTADKELYCYKQGVDFSVVNTGEVLPKEVRYFYKYDETYREFLICYDIDRFEIATDWGSDIHEQICNGAEVPLRQAIELYDLASKNGK